MALIPTCNAQNQKNGKRQKFFFFLKNRGHHRDAITLGRDATRPKTHPRDAIRGTRDAKILTDQPSRRDGPTSRRDTYWFCTNLTAKGPVRFDFKPTISISTKSAYIQYHTYISTSFYANMTKSTIPIPNTQTCDNYIIFVLRRYMTPKEIF